MESRSARLRSPVVAVLPALPAIGIATESVTVQWYGQSATRLQGPDNGVIVIDPFLRNSPVIPDRHRDLDRPGNADLIVATHARGDHSGDTVELAEPTGTPEPFGEAPDDGDVELIGMEPGDRRTFD